MSIKRWSLLAAVAVTFPLAACGGDDDSSSTTKAPASSEAPSTEAPASTDAPAEELTGTIVVSGSSTVEPISIAVAEEFAAANSKVDISVDGPGTGDGFKLFCAGETDINDASSKVKDSQLEECAANGIEMIELRVGNDGISMMTNINNSAVDCVSFPQIYALIGPESQGFGSWSDANVIAAELGDTTSLPDAPLSIVGPGEESGTFSSFIEIVIEEFNEDRGFDATTRPDYQASADDNIIVQGIQGSDTSLGWVGFAFAREATDVKLLQVAEEAGGECVTPTDATIADNSYPISRPLFIYVNKAKAESNPALAAFVDYYLSDDGIANVSEVGYVSLSDADLQSLRDTWDSRTAFTK